LNVPNVHAKVNATHSFVAEVKELLLETSCNRRAVFIGFGKFRSERPVECVLKFSSGIVTGDSPGKRPPNKAAERYTKNTGGGGEGGASKASAEC
jgi:hypothetical protein